MTRLGPFGPLALAPPRGLFGQDLAPSPQCKHDPDPDHSFCTSARLEIEASDITSCFLLRMLVVQVHERSMDMDFVLTLLRHALPSRPELKALPVFYLWGI